MASFDKIQVDHNIELQLINEHDHHELIQLMERIYPPVYDYLWEDKGVNFLNTMYGHENLKRELADESAIYWFIFFEEKNIGILRLIQHANIVSFHDKSILKIHRIYLDPECHGRGIGRKIMSWAEDFAIDLKYDGIWLQAMAPQQKAIEFYNRVGYKAFGEEKLPFKLMYPEFRLLILMIKWLN